MSRMFRPGLGTLSLATCTIAVACAGVAFAETTTSNSSSTSSMPVFSGRPSFMSLRLHSVQTVNHNTKRLVFAFPDENACSGLSLTSSLLTFMRPNNAWLPVLRPYTPISDLSEPGFIELLVKKYPNGKASSHLHSLQPGNTLTFVVPLKGYVWTPNKHSHVYLVAGGAGITPMYQLIQGALKNPTDRTKITLVFGANTEEDLVLREELDGFKSQYPDRFNVVYAISNPAKGESRHFEKGRISEELLKRVIKSGNESGEKDVKVFICGPPAMETALMGSTGWFHSDGGILGKLGYTKDQIYKF